MRNALRHPRYPLSEQGRRLETIKAGRDGIFDLLLSYERQDYTLKFGEADLLDSRQLFSGKARYPLGVTICELTKTQLISSPPLAVMLTEVLSRSTTTPVLGVQLIAVRSQFARIASLKL